jgi:hypothetical protein
MKKNIAQGLTTRNEFASYRLRSRRHSQVSDGRLRQERDSIHRFCQQANQVAVDKTS